MKELLATQKKECAERVALCERHTALEVAHDALQGRFDEAELVRAKSEQCVSRGEAGNTVRGT